MRFNTTLAVCAAALIGAAGCGGSAPKTGLVKGKVTLSGMPVAGAKVALYSSSETMTPDAVAVSAPDGTYSVTAKPGSYKVAVSKLVPKKGAILPPDAADNPTQLEASGLGVNELPKQYASARNTSLSATVSDSESVVDLELKAK